jgi:hypothetical protein
VRVSTSVKFACKPSYKLLIKLWYQGHRYNRPHSVPLLTAKALSTQPLQLGADVVEVSQVIGRHGSRSHALVEEAHHHSITDQPIQGVAHLDVVHTQALSWSILTQPLARASFPSRGARRKVPHTESENDCGLCSMRIGSPASIGIAPTHTFVTESHVIYNSECIMHYTTSSTGCQDLCWLRVYRKSVGG